MKYSEAHYGRVVLPSQAPLTEAANTNTLARLAEIKPRFMNRCSRASVSEAVKAPSSTA